MTPERKFHPLSISVGRLSESILVAQGGAPLVGTYGSMKVVGVDPKGPVPLKRLTPRNVPLERRLFVLFAVRLIRGVIDLNLRETESDALSRPIFTLRLRHVHGRY